MSVGGNWDDLINEAEAERFVGREQELDLFRKEIVAYSNRLPVLISWLAAPEGGIAETTVPTHDIVERFLRWITDPILRCVALVGAIPHRRERKAGHR